MFDKSSMWVKEEGRSNKNDWNNLANHEAHKPCGYNSPVNSRFGWDYWKYTFE